MKNESQMDKRIYEGIEACRPASEDLDDGELAEVAGRVNEDPQARLVYDRVQEFDAAILKSIDDVPVPAGLAERILDSLREAEQQTNGHGDAALAGVVAAATTTGEPPSEASVVPALGSSGRFGFSRRRATAAAITALLACVLLIVVVNLLQESSELELVDLASHWQGKLGDDWQQTAPPADFAVPAAVQNAASRWQWVDRYLAVPVVAYELQNAKGGRAMLFVARMNRAGLPSAPPVRPQWASGKAVAYWQSGARVYVLVMENERSYQDFVRTSAAPFA